MRKDPETGKRKQTDLGECYLCRKKKRQLRQAAKTNEKIVVKKEAKRIEAKRLDNQKTIARTKANRVEAELVRRILAKRHLLRFIQRFNTGYQAGWVHRLICRKLEEFVEKVERRESPRLMLFMPPRHGKSLIASQNFPAWALGRHPEFEVIAASYGTSLPLKFSRAVRALLRDPAYKAIFTEARLDPDNENIEGWQTTKGGGYVPAGVGAGITGKGAHILIIDDPVKDAEEADSATIRESTWDWFGSTAYTRLAPGGGVLIINTRWHDDDLAGRAITAMNDALRAVNEERVERLKRGEDPGGVEAWYQQALKEIDRWEIVSFPAVAENDEYLSPAGDIVTVALPGYERLRAKGEALHPERFDAAKLARIKRTLQPRHWSALYQQNPVPEEGAYFTKEMFRFEPVIPDYREWYVFSAWDLAIGKNQTNDWTVGVVGAVDHEDNLHILDLVRARMDTLEIVEAILAVEVKYKPMMLGIEKGQLEMALMAPLKEAMAKRKVYPTLAQGDNALKPVQDKLIRARPLQGRMQQGRVLLPSSQPWADKVQQELLRFPGGVHDDIVDAMAWLVRLSSKFGAPKERKKDPKLKSWRDKIKGRVVGGRQKSVMEA